MHGLSSCSNCQSCLHLLSNEYAIPILRRVFIKDTGNLIFAASMCDLSGSETKIGITLTHGNDLFQMTVNKVRNKFVNT